MSSSQTKGQILYSCDNDVFILKFVGEIRLNICGGLDDISNNRLNQCKLERMIVDLTEAVTVDSTALGLLAKVAMESNLPNEHRPVILCTNNNIHRILLSMRFDKLFNIVEEAFDSEQDLSEAPSIDESEIKVCERSLKAHRVLMDLSATNRIRFEDVVKALEKELNIGD